MVLPWWFVFGVFCMGFYDGGGGGFARGVLSGGVLSGGFCPGGFVRGDAIVVQM